MGSSQNRQQSSTWSSGDKQIDLTTPVEAEHVGGFRGRLKSLRRTTTDKSKTSTPDNLRGALGLNLLHEPSEPRVDFVFVHGLNGGSRRTWSATSDPSTFWPKEWLPSEAGFRHVRISSFGYDSDWTKSQPSTLTIHDYGQALLADLYNSLSLRKNGNTPIVLVAHSMGGLIVKKAYLLARRDPIYQEFAKRIHSLYFLATPHRGADSTSFLTTFISMSLGSSGSKSFVKELIPGSGTLQVINDEFRHVCQDVHLWSFFEGLPTQVGPKYLTVVEKESAVLGLPGEHTQFLQADHRHVVKFETAEDTNYNILLRCFNTTIAEIEKEYIADRFENHKAQMKLIAAAFDIPDRPDGDFNRVVDKLHDGSCEWLTEHASFQDWLVEDPSEADSNMKVTTLNPSRQEPAGSAPRYLWLNGPPGSGKSVASTHVIRHLESYNLDCAYFYFKANERFSISHMLLSLALQMAESNFQIRHTFLAMIEEGETINSQSDHTMVWSNLFLGRIFKMTLSQPQYWVIDALDECPSKALSVLLPMFARIDPSFPLKIFMSSRPNGLVERLLNQEKIQRVEMHTGQAESLKDIEIFVRSRLSPNILEGFGSEEQAETKLVAEIMEKSNGIFLWASLIMDRLDEAHSIEAMRDTLNQVPTEMSGLYQGILADIKASPNAELSLCILRWVVCARKPLTTEELREVVRLDINQTLRTSDRFAQICGNMITVEDNQIRVMHQTVKEFLTGEQSGFYIDRSWSHARIATLCLQHLNGKNFLPPRAHRPSPSKVNAEETVFDEYAIANFSYHIAHCTPSEATHNLLPLLGAFISSNVLTWIERVATTSRLYMFSRAIKHLKSYLTRQVITCSPLNPDYSVTLRFLEDLTRLGAIYGPNLLLNPSIIYTLIPLLCPKSSVIQSKFAKQFRQKVICSFNEEWDERLTSFSYPSRVLSIACFDPYFAIGLSDSSIKVYRSTTFELVANLQHGEPVRRLASGMLTNVLVSGGIKWIKMWGPRQEPLWTVPMPDHALWFEFSPDDSKLYVAVKTGEVFVYRVKTGQRLEALPVLGEEQTDSDSDNADQHQRVITPSLMRICPKLGIAAIAYRSSHLKLSYYDSDERVDTFVKEGYEDGVLPPQILDVAFNLVLEQNLMAVSYLDGDLVTLDPWSLQQRNTYHLHAVTLAASPDGSTLAAGDSECVISLFAFDSLRLICRISSMEERIMGIVFASNSLRFFDLRGSSCNVWEPAVLIKKSMADDSSSEDSDEFLTPASSLVCNRSFEGSNNITVVAQAGDLNYVFCGREEGSITVHDTNTGKVCAEFKYHARMVDIRHLEWNPQTKVLFSVDASRRCFATRFAPPTTAAPAWKQLDHTLDFRAADTVLQVVVSADGTMCLVSTTRGEEIHDATPGPAVTDGTIPAPTPLTATFPTPTPTTAAFPIGAATTLTNYSGKTGRWLQHPTDAERLLLIDGHRLHVFRWKSLERETDAAGIELTLPAELAGATVAADDWCSRAGYGTLHQSVAMYKSPSETAFLTVDIPAAPAAGAAWPRQVDVVCTARQLVSGTKGALGIYKSSLYFLSSMGWVCSISLKGLPASKSYVRHFFIPSVWLNSGATIARVVSKTTVVLAYRDELVVFQGFLDFEHKTNFDEIVQEGAVVPLEPRSP
ncbi:hypothetical protein B0T26DRAFT_755844 [Lasiosphaeria miniovina]|uniref:GPI inositol-deacylase n=1 Tax=Lasiosphaeria miniovina TaxID=1954250 RepID=A0AA39ZZ75_9PEZI|nr:uncharacterized protein B0T26DRAFT_755844 [Lasiosphaeria miniovina]KAK0706330.1 hypothetical protein B0T26DRAFT_755844 [Lasiosphaeria miniovina]